MKILNKFIDFAKKFNIDIKWDTPSIFKKDKMIISVTGDEVNLKKFLIAIKYLGDVERISFKKETFKEK